MASRSSGSRSSGSRSSGSRSSGSRSSGSRSSGRSRSSTSSSGARASSSSRAAQEAVDRIRELNERITENARKAGSTYLDIYERTLNTIAGYQEELAKASPSDWIQRMIEAQANFTREIGNFYASSAREVFKR